MGELICDNGFTFLRKTFVNITALRSVAFKVFKYFEVKK
jgi:hypothetical protein